MYEQRFSPVCLGAVLFMLAFFCAPASASAAAPTVQSLVVNGVPLAPDTSVLATSSTVWSAVVTFDQDIATPPDITDWDGVGSFGSAQTVSDCGDSNAKTFCFTYALPSVASPTFWFFQITSAQNAGLETMAPSTNSYRYLIDTVGPTITMPDVTTNVVLPTIGGSVDAFSYYHRVDLSIINTTLGVSRSYSDSVAGTTWSVTLPFGDNLPEGVYALTATSTDLQFNGSVVGNHGPIMHATLIVSTSAPGLTITSGPAQNGFLASSTAQFGFATSSLVSVTTTCAFDTDTPATCYGTSATSSLSEGLHAFTATSTDFFGNQTVVNRAFTVDTIAPVVTEVAPIATSTNTTPSYSFISSEDGTLSYAGGCSATTTSTIAGTTTLTFAALSPNTYASCTITVTDTAGNAGVLAVSPFLINAVPVAAANPGSGNGVLGGPLSVGYQTPYTAPTTVIPTPPAGTPEPVVETPTGAVAGAAVERTNTPHTAAPQTAVTAANAGETSSAETSAPDAQTPPQPSLGAAAATSGFTLPSWAPFAGFVLLLGGAGWFFLRRRTG